MKKIRLYIEKHPRKIATIWALMETHYVLTGHPVHKVFECLVGGKTDAEICKELGISATCFTRLCQRMSDVVRFRIWLEKTGQVALDLGSEYLPKSERNTTAENPNEDPKINTETKQITLVPNWSMCEYTATDIDPVTRSRVSI